MAIRRRGVEGSLRSPADAPGFAKEDRMHTPPDPSPDRPRGSNTDFTAIRTGLPSRTPAPGSRSADLDADGSADLVVLRVDDLPEEIRPISGSVLD